MIVAGETRPDLSRRIAMLVGLGLAAIALSHLLESITKPVLGPDISASAGTFMIGVMAYWGPSTLFPGKKPLSPLARLGMAVIFGLVMAVLNWGFNRLLR